MENNPSYDLNFKSSSNTVKLAIQDFVKSSIRVLDTYYGIVSGKDSRINRKLFRAIFPKTNGNHFEKIIIIDYFLK